MDGGAFCFERLQVMRDDVPKGGAVNMAVDEILLNSITSVPLLRFYRWARPTVSFGYFGAAEEARHVAGGREIVRRQTGGGIVEHGDDVTYTLVVPRTDAFTRLRSAESYRLIHAAVARALERCGLASQTHAAPPPKLSDESQPGACFERPVLHDLMADGKKVAGGAQRRNRVGLLHQGSIQPNTVLEPRWEDRLHRELTLALAGIIEPRTATSEEIVRAETLAATRYATAAWTDRV